MEGLTPYIIIGIIALVIIYVLLTLNKLIKLNNKVKEAFATMDVYLKKRWDLIPNLVEAVKGYAKHEKETLIGVIEMRRPVTGSSIAEKQECEAQMNQAMKNINIVMERYPELKADKNFAQLNSAVMDIEDNLQLML